ncbi:thymidine kinase [Bacteriovorax sp. Seq25_V]|uniref:thymidine kinase n=1 Tax=Bacteriovorax sp. Seq25_V TaxID=1201288 RepID=UPI000419E790|nr:thymidine kinase [Bacteriovorax sp. Seq25_V]
MSYLGNHMHMSGGIEVVCGPMFSGKTEELIRRVKRAQIARQKVQIFKPAIDDRYHATDVVSHSSQAIEATPVKDALDILQKVFDSTRIVAIDEVQFFDATITKVVQKLARRGIRVICAGLDQDSCGEPFGPMPQLLCIADDVMKIQAICTVCGAPATKSYRKPTKNQDQVLVGESDMYEARCRSHFDYFGEEEDVMAFSISLGGLKRINENGQAEIAAKD